MKILQLTKKFPYPLKDGEAIAITYLARGLHQLGCELTLLSMNTVKHFFDRNTLPAAFDHYKQIELVTIDNRLKAKDALLNLFSGQSYHIERFDSEDYKQQLIQLLQANTYDIIQLETLYLAPYVPTIRKYSKAKVVMRSHNVEHEIWQRITDNTSWGPKKWYLSLLSKRLKNYEQQMLNAYDMLVAITQRDLDFFESFGSRLPSHVAPIGLDSKRYTPSLQYKKVPSFCFIGSLDWMPNLEGVEWVLQEVWPKVVEQFPSAVFHVAGRNTPEHLLKQAWPNVKMHGEVPSAVDFINAHEVMLVPLFSGSGMRVKILEGMALGKAVVSTTIGLEGIAAKDQEEVLIADTVNLFVQAIVDCLSGQVQVEQMGKKAITFIEKTFDNRTIAKKLLDFYQNSLNLPAKGN